MSAANIYDEISATGIHQNLNWASYNVKDLNHTQTYTGLLPDVTIQVRGSDDDCTFSTCTAPAHRWDAVGSNGDTQWSTATTTVKVPGTGGSGSFIMGTPASGFGDVGFNDDGDTFSENALDCDDTDEDTYPGAPESPDYKDNDCDGTIDENTTLSDDDGDGYAEVNNDCNDLDEEISPSAVEICDSVDNDCTGHRRRRPAAHACHLPQHRARAAVGATAGDAAARSRGSYRQAACVCAGAGVRMR